MWPIQSFEADHSILIYFNRLWRKNDLEMEVGFNFIATGSSQVRIAFPTTWELLFSGGGRCCLYLSFLAVSTPNFMRVDSSDLLMWAKRARVSSSYWRVCVAYSWQNCFLDFLVCWRAHSLSSIWARKYLFQTPFSRKIFSCWNWAVGSVVKFHNKS